MPRPAGKLSPHQTSFRFARDATALALVAPSKKLLALRRDRDALVAKVKRKGLARDELEASVQTASAALRAQLSPLLAELRELSQAVHLNFQRLLVSKLSAPARRAVRELYQALAYCGLLAPLEEEPDEPAELDEEPDPMEDWDRREAPPSPRMADPSPAPDAEPEDTEHASALDGEGAQAGNLKTLFRQLASVLHPDRVQHSDDKAKRTEAMKELTQAYAKGNLAGMLAVKQSWEASDQAPAKATSEQESVAELERTIKQLKAQLRAIERDLREIRRESPLADVPGFKHSPGVDPAPAIAHLLSQITGERDQLREALDFVVAFSERRMPLADFRLGPRCLQKRRPRA
jgi:hypothetical protein